MVTTDDKLDLILKMVRGLVEGQVAIQQRLDAQRAWGPRFEHPQRCEHCRYLGHFDNYDLWLCKANGSAELLARFGDARGDVEGKSADSAADTRGYYYADQCGDPNPFVGRLPFALRVAYLIAEDLEHV